MTTFCIAFNGSSLSTVVRNIKPKGKPCNQKELEKIKQVPVVKLKDKIGNYVKYYLSFEALLSCAIFFRLKTGNVPPEDFPFEEAKPGGELNYQTLHKKSRKRGLGKSSLFFKRLLLI
jgi:hypothetical protein